MDAIREDFDRLATFADDRWDHNSHYHEYLLRQLPAQMDHALDLGCGAGAFTRLLARRATQVIGVDLSPGMIEAARARSVECPNIEYQIADVLDWDWPAGHFDCIVSIAALHHLPLAQIAPRIKAGLRAGGVLLVLDLYQSSQPLDYLLSAVAVPLSVIQRLWHNGRLNPSPEEQAAWEEHGQRDQYLTMPELRRLYAEHFPDAQVRPQLYWRYSAHWRSDRPG